MSENTPAPADDVVDWRKLAINLAMREADYRLNHDVHGGSDIRAGRAWDQMRQAGDRVRDATLAAKPDQPAVGEEITRLRAENERLREAVAECVDAMRDWIVTDGISGNEAMKRIVGALDNPRINPVILEMDKQALQETGDGPENLLDGYWS